MSTAKQRTAMEKNGKIVIVGILVVAALAGATYTYFSAKEPRKSGKTLVARTKADRKSALMNRPKTPLSLASKKVRGEEKPDLSLDDEFENSLSPELKKLMAELQQALDDESLASVTKIAERIHALQQQGGDKAVPAEVRSKLVETLGWFLPDSLSDLVAFLADQDPDVHQDVLTQFEDALDDTSLSDRELSAIVKSFSKVITDEDALDALFFCIENEMRNSVALDTYRHIIANGNDAAKARVYESIEDFTGEEGILNEEALDKWGADPENADDEDDEDFYAGETEDFDE